MTVRVRFAPSPTGRLHLGNVRAALLNWLFARKSNGRFLLRLDDTDKERSRPEFATAIEDDLRWLGISWDEFARQSDRLDRYEAAAEKLKADGRLYACFETPEELKLRRFGQIADGGAQVYDRAALRLTERQVADYAAEGRRPHWRFRLEHAETGWEDLIRGRCAYHGTKLSDPVLVRADGMPTYTLASVVDDVEFAVSHVVRGEDHVTNTAVQIQIFEALGQAAGELKFAHFPLISDIGGHSLSKRLGSLSIENLRNDGIEPSSITSLIARLGTSDPIEVMEKPADLVDGFSFSKFGRASPKLDPDEIVRINAKLVHRLPFSAVADRLPAGADAAFWESVRPNLSKVGDAVEWWSIARSAVMPINAEPDFLTEAARLLPPEPWSADTWGAWTKALGASTGRKGKELFLPLRLALTAREHGPEMKSLMPMIGRSRTLARLEGRKA
ncbi:MAG: glutamate--tRNA ligase [Alphaproteobacteria bacterium]|nr:glutamate--tRNA ligase [Alphaproteobacteria bacterium]